MNKPKIYMGIDVGYTGAIALIDEGFVTVHPMPIILATGKKGKTQYNFQEVMSIFREYPLDQIGLVAIEKALVMPGQGVVSSSRFTEGFGELKGILRGMGIPFIAVHPTSWKAEVLRGMEWKGNKSVSITYAQQKHPSVSLLPTSRCRKPSDGMADAICLAEYAKIKEDG